MFFKSKKNAAEYDQQTATYFIRLALVLQSTLYRDYGRDDLAVEVEYSGMLEEQYPKDKEVPDSNRPYIVITNVEREDKQETEDFRLNVDSVAIAFPSVISDLSDPDEHWYVQASNDDIMTRNIKIANDTISDRMLLRLATTVNALI